MTLKLAILSHVSPFVLIDKKIKKKNFFQKVFDFIFYNSNGNIGHNFMYYGLLNILKKIPMQKNIRNFEQHKPFSVIYENNLLKYLNFFNHNRFFYLKKFLFNKDSKKKFEFKNNEFDFTISCGGPNLALVNTLSPQIWFTLHNFYNYFKKRSTFIDTGIGSCKAYKKNNNVKQYKIFKRYVKNCKVLVARDEFAYKILNSIKEPDSKLYYLPCTSFFSAPTKVRSRKKYILINYMKSGANNSWGQSIDQERWYQIIKNYADYYSTKYEIKFFAHNINDYYECKKKFLEYETIYPKSKSHYFKIADEAILGICNRLHCALPLASALTPSILIGTDSRILSVKLLNIPFYFVNNISLDILINKTNNILENQKLIRNNLRKLKKKYENEYKKIFLNLLKQKFILI
jgi:hypothetical protein